jgi:cyclopropane-fatty-acyl-phospholipid synthase
MMTKLLRVLLSKVELRGTLEVLPAGETQWERFGDGSLPHVRMRIVDKWTQLKLILDPEVEFGEAFMDGRILFEEGTVYDFLQILLSARGHTIRIWRPAQLLGRIRDLIGRLFGPANPIGKAARRVRQHYDLSDELFDLFLDSDRQYSCAYFPTPHGDIELAQRAKKRHIAAKLLIRPGLKLLDIGSGWGGLGLEMARRGAKVTGVTLSVGQHAVSNLRAREAGLTGQADFQLRDYRLVDGTFDRIVSVGMLEHVGAKSYNEYFAKIAKLLDTNGVALVHSICRSDGPGATNPWITRHIFPGGHIPALSEILAAIERSGLYVTDIETLRLHYAETLRAWRTRFMARRAEAVALYDERFALMWEFYLAACEAYFRWDTLFVFQIQLAKRLDAAPVTRDYMVDAERAMADAEEKGRAREVAKTDGVHEVKQVG